MPYFTLHTIIAQKIWAYQYGVAFSVQTWMNVQHTKFFSAQLCHKKNFSSTIFIVKKLKSFYIVDKIP